MKNAMCLVLLSQSTPLIFMGDEFGNSQRGNNNPYCQDNAVTWLDWRGMERNADLHGFWKMLAGFPGAMAAPWDRLETGNDLLSHLSAVLLQKSPALSGLVSLGYLPQGFLKDQCRQN